MNDMMRMGSFLFIIAAVAGVLLAFTENITSPLIGENRIKMLQQARREVLPAAKSFTDAKHQNSDGSESFSYVAGFDESGKLAGVVINAAPKGYAGPIEMVLGLDPDGKIQGVKILSQKETPGLGTKLAEQSFLDPFKKVLAEKETPIFLVKQDGGDIDGITAATISSRAFCSGLRETVKRFTSIKDSLAELKPAPKEIASGTGGAQ